MSIPAIERKSRRAAGGFTLIELLVVVAIIAILASLLLPTLARAQAKGERLVCLNNFRQINVFMQLYTDANQDVFPAHRNLGLDTDNPDNSVTNWWGTAIVTKGSASTNLFHDPTIKHLRLDNGVKWNWDFNCHLVGYGFNGFFLGIHPYTGGDLTVGGVRVITKPWFKRSQIISPSQSLVMGDKQPYGNPPVWSSSLWWPNGCMDPKLSASGAFEGIDPKRHLGASNVGFNDGHAEWRQDKQINPPVDPGAGTTKGLINSQFWDPLQRGGNQ